MSTPYEEGHANGRRLLTRLLLDEAGSYILYMTLLMPGLIGAIGFGTEGSLWLYTRQMLQGAADAAAVSAGENYAISNSPDISTQANAIISNHGFVIGTGSNKVTVAVNSPALSGNYQSANGYSSCSATRTLPCSIEVIATKLQPPLFSALWLSGGSIPGRAVATVAAATVNENCFLALATAGTTISASGGASVSTPNCSIFSNSNSNAAISLAGSGTLHGLSVGAVGGLTSQGGGTITTGPSGGSSCPPTCTQTGAFTDTFSNAPIADPYAGVTVPSAGACLVPPAGSACTTGKGKNQIATNAWCLTGGGNDFTLNPGTYCGGISMSARTVSLNPGVYIMAYSSFAGANANALSVTNGTVLNGNGVTLVFTSGDGTYPAGGTPIMNLSGGSGGTLTAPTSGATAGMVIFGDRTMPVGTQFLITNGSTTGWTFNGAAYVPRGAMNFTGGQTTTSPCTQFIANTFVLGGGGTYQSTGCPGGVVLTPLGPPVVALVE